jgi:hypothetical protein
MLMLDPALEKEDIVHGSGGGGGIIVVTPATGNGTIHPVRFNAAGRCSFCCTGKTRH